MCLIIVKKKNVALDAAALFRSLEISSIKNNSGFGFAFKRDNQSFLSKGHKEVESLIEEIKKVGIRNKDELIVHLRNPSPGTGSNISNSQLAHPFVVTSDVKLLYQKRAFTKLPIFAHNGKISSFILPTYDPTSSDSFLFVKDVLSVPHMVEMMGYMYRKSNLKKLYNSLFDTNRFVIMKPNQSISLFGEWIEEKNLHYSNDSYKIVTRDTDDDDYSRHGLRSDHRLPFERLTSEKNLRSARMCDTM